MKRVLILLLSSLTSLACDPAAVTLRVDRPTVAELDPLLSDFATEARIRVHDGATDRTFETEFALDPPQQLELEEIPWGEDVEVELEVLSSIDGAMAGYGRYRGPVEEGGEVGVPVRKLLAYLADRDEDDDPGAGLGMPLRALDVGPAQSPALDSLPSVLESYDISRPNGVYVTADGLHLVVGGQDLDDDTAGLITIFTTADHEIATQLPVPSRVSGLAPLADGRTAVASLWDDNAVIVLDTDTMTVTERVLFDDQGGDLFLDVGGIGAAPAGRVAYVVGRMRGPGAPRVPRVFRVDVDGDVTTADGADGRSFEDVRVRPDGEEIFVLEYGGGDGSNAKLEVRDAATLQLTDTVDLQQDPAKPFQLFVNPNGRHLHVQRDVIYNPNCCGGTEVLDMQTHDWVFETSDVSIASATGLPDGRLIGGLSHFSNDAGGQLIWIESPTELGVKIGVSGYVGHAFAMAAPFQDRL